ncbi:hypothetical protein [Streptomyces sp. 1331.2]|uniref:hypothetical protein n=1 Tax=Streptomyces sp. 1331.2 TaxID=1938835 RepID=UPI000BE2AC51|nr:hypothetical protein [Streptomyces sp. 1331.2]
MAGATVVSDTDNPKPLDGRRIGGTIVPQAFGGTLAGPVRRDALDGALADTPPGVFPPVRLP